MTTVIKNNANTLAVLGLILTIIGYAIVFGGDKNQIKTNTDTLQSIQKEIIPKINGEIGSIKTDQAVLSEQIKTLKETQEKNQSETMTFLKEFRKEMREELAKKKDK